MSDRVSCWGSTEADRAALAARPNIHTVDPVDDIEDVLAQTRILVMPSLWDEAFGLTVRARVPGIAMPTILIPIWLRLRMGDRFEPGPWTPASTRATIAPRLESPAAEPGVRSEALTHFLGVLGERVTRDDAFAIGRPDQHDRGHG